MTKSDVATMVAERIGVEKGVALKVLEESLEAVAEGLESGKSVYFRGFGSFTIKKRRAKVAHNFLKGTTIPLPERYVPTLKFCDSVKERVADAMRLPL